MGGDKNVEILKASLGPRFCMLRKFGSLGFCGARDRVSPSFSLSLSLPLSPLASPSTEGEGLVEFSAMAMGGERKGTNPGRGGPSNQPRLVLREV